MKKFRYKYPVWIILVIIAALILALACLGLNIYRIISAKEAETFDYMSFSITVLISLIAAVLFSAMLISSGYKLTDTELVLYWGFLKNKLELKTLTRIVLEESREKLVLYYNEDNFFVLNAKTVDVIALVDEIRKKNDKIVFEITSVPEKPENTKNP